MANVSAVFTKANREALVHTPVFFAPAGGYRLSATAIGEDVPWRELTNEGGFVSVELLAGEYFFWVNQGRVERFEVPDDDRTYLLVDLILREEVVGGALVEQGDNYKIVEGVMYLLNATTGDWLPWWLGGSAGSEVVLLAAPASPGSGLSYYLSEGSFSVWNVDQLAFQQVYVEGENGAYSLVATPVGGVSAETYRMSGTALQLKNLTTGRWHTVYAWGEAGSEQFAIGPEQL